MKQCKCGETDLTKFGKAKHRADGLKPLCKTCHNAYNNKKRQSSPEQHRATNLAYARSERGKQLNRANNLRRDYWPHLTNEQALAEYQRLFDLQKGCCDLCKRHQVVLGHTLHVDHCKHTKIVRGLLCNVCNRIKVQDKTYAEVVNLMNYFDKYHKKSA